MTRQLLLTMPILRQMREIEGWFFEEEADLLIAAVADALTLTPPHALVEVGSYCGRTTVVLGAVVKALGVNAHVFAIDPHEGEVGAADADLKQTGSTLSRFEENIARSRLADVVTLLRQRSYETAWSNPISFLLVDGLHDYVNVSRDFRHFEPWLRDGAIIAFHDYSSNFPGVIAFVDELIASGRYESLGLVSSLRVVRAGGA